MVRLVKLLRRDGHESFITATAVLAQTIADVHARGMSTSLAVWPLVALDPPGHAPWQAVLGTPVDGLGASHVSVMMYTSMLEGWSRGAFRRKDVTTLLGAATARAVNRWGSSAGISLGCVGVGAFGDEPVYRQPSELLEDAVVARRAGCQRVSLFDLGGVVSKGPPEVWLEALSRGVQRPVVEEQQPRWANGSTRVLAARALARAATRILERSRFA
jgi:hypothetical protein